MKIARAMMRMRKRAIATTIPSGTTRIAAPTTDVHGSQKKQTRAARSRAFRVRSRAPWWPRTHARRPAVAATRARARGGARRIEPGGGGGGGEGGGGEEEP